MTVKLLAQWGDQPPGTLYTAATAGTETAMIAAGQATANLAGGVVWVPPGGSPDRTTEIYFDPVTQSLVSGDEINFVIKPTVGSVTAYQPARLSLPDRLPVFENFSRISSFTVAQSGATFTADADSGVFLPSCINMATSVGAGSNATGTKNLKFNQNTVDGMWLFARTNNRQSAAAPGITLYAGPLVDLGSGNRWTYALGSTLSGLVGEQAVWIPKTSWTILDGSPSWASDMLSYRVRVDSHAVDAKDIDLLGMMWGGAKATIIITFDDGWDTSYSVGWVEAQARNIPLTHYIIAGELDTANNVTTAQVQAMKASGDYIGLHGLDTWDVTSRIASDVAAVTATGLSDCKHAAYPEGNVGTGYNWRTVTAAMRASGVITARLANVQTPALLGYTDPLLLPSYPLSSSLSLANAKIAVDQAILSGGTVIFYGHKLAGAADSLTWVTSDYTELLDYINQRRITRQLEVTTIDKWAAQLYLNAL